MIKSSVTVKLNNVTVRNIFKSDFNTENSALRIGYQKIIQTAYTFEQTKAYEAPELAKEDR